MPVFHDQLNREVNISAIPQRIVSIVPSQTELLFYLGLDRQIVGVTKFCIHPKEKVKLLTKIGGTKQLDLELIKSLKPDLIIANKEENERNQVEALMNVCPVWISDINNIEGALSMIQSVGIITGKTVAAKDLCRNITLQFQKFTLSNLNLSVAYFIWRKPYMVAGVETYIDSLLKLCGLKNAFNTYRYPEVTPADLIQANPGILLLSSEPYPFKQKHIDEFKQLLPHAKVILVDGEMFSWYGNRLLQVPGYLANLVKLI
ncbi:helical backbone metal receptor [Mucilaginibacter dorajii]|uniref:Helical backbone metal receptor n=1 Tax=Mucilaginibacter dorajii TaxID=692994 RepID=A0ABP7R754_9SPHI|nr:helical backbone metal receptor [Mucilaginibacter dorajii]MCS3737410.1 ABC-type Fe3+-hydroxamate transport system substrate-binding protein [Mucilaginibacter dorajii]